MAGPVRRLDLRDRPAGGALRTLVAHRKQLLVGHIGADLALRAFDPLLDLGQVLIGQLRPRRGPVQLAAGSAAVDVVLHRVVRAAGQLPGITQRPCQVVGIQNFHDLLGRLQLIPSSGRWGASAPLIAPEEGASTAQRGEADDVVSGRSHDRQWAVLMSASGQFRGRLRAVSRGRRQTARPRVASQHLFCAWWGLRSATSRSHTHASMPTTARSRMARSPCASG